MNSHVSWKWVTYLTNETESFNNIILHYLLRTLEHADNI